MVPQTCCRFQIPKASHLTDYVTNCLYYKFATVTDAILAEWSKAIRSGRTIFGCVSSNLTDCISLFAVGAFEYSKCQYINKEPLTKFQLLQLASLDRLQLSQSFPSHLSKSVVQSVP
jgi:hypothetical protein